MLSGTIIWTSAGAIYFVPGDLEAYRVGPDHAGGPALGRADLDRAGMLSAHEMHRLRDLAGPGHLIAEIRPVLIDRDPHTTKP